MRRLPELIAASPVFAGLGEEELHVIARCGRNVRFAEGELLASEGDPADTFYLVRRGRVALELHQPDRGGLVIDTADPGDVVGWSWLVPPYRWHFDARAAEPVAAVAFDGACLRRRCEDDPFLGYELMKRFAQVIVDRLQHTRFRLLDVYGGVGAR
ncbi:MAG: cyclic nucleotide-binding domain-containing protein [Thermoleophilia bacterium]|nr:cyclic nucleotide-binding domain-containing protein [Gaiellaceae bacterium]MDW8339503.1 cyclic nucleotide-binding domain-containing protein [Thermoleophilia bacterium]